MRFVDGQDDGSRQPQERESHKPRKLAGRRQNAPEKLLSDDLLLNLTQVLGQASRHSMNNEQSKEFEKKLLEKRRGIAANPSRIGLATDSGPEYGRDEGDRASASQAKEMTWLRTSQERGLLELVDAALSRIRDGTFGECLHCGREIGAKRLAAVPWTRYCITCQELLEQFGR